MNSKHDVIVIGGGPAGSSAAAWLSRLGHDVVLFEREKFPREHVGESLLPFCYNLLDDLGVVPELKLNFVRKPGVRFIDRDGKSLLPGALITSSRMRPICRSRSFAVNSIIFCSRMRHVVARR